MKKIILSFSIVFALYGCVNKVIQELPSERIYTNPLGNGQVLEIEYKKGLNHNHPLMAIWIEDMEGNYVQTLFIAQSIAKGVFEHGTSSEGFWQPGEIRRPAALPVWSHNRGVKAKDGLFTPDTNTQVPDAYTGATPRGSFVLSAKLNENLSGTYKIRFEINQTWDWNEYWTNNKFPDNEEYKTSCQPALVYEAIVDFKLSQKDIPMKVIGHSHYAGENGEINVDITTITTAFNITEELWVRIIEN